MSKTKKIFSLVCIIGLMGAALVSCGGDKAKDQAKDDKVLIAATEPTFDPFDTVDENGKLVGFDMDLMNAIAKNQGFKVEYKQFEFDSLIPAIQSDAADMITAGMNGDNPDRRKKVDFSDPYYKSGLVVLVKKDNDKIKDMDSIGKDSVVASQIGTTGADKANELKEEGKIKDVKINNGYDQCFLMLENGDVNAVIVDKPVAEKIISKNKNLKIVGDTVNAESFAFAVKKGNTELLEKINAGLKNVIADGTYDKLYKQWFGTEPEKH